jgi:hypothetical protein
MSPRSDQSLPEWQSALDQLLVRLDQIGRPGTPAWPVKAHTISRLQREFARAGCIPLANWLAGRGGLNPAELTDEIKAAAPHCVIAGLSRVPNYTLCLPDDQQAQGLELDALHRRAIRAAQDQLDGERPSVPPEWEGDDWEELDPQVRRLLLYMHGREDADLRELCLQVWGKEYLVDGGVTEKARETATSKANCLRKLESRRVLCKVRRENRLRWERA